MSERCPKFHFEYRCVRDADDGHTIHRVTMDSGDVFSWSDMDSYTIRISSDQVPHYMQLIASRYDDEIRRLGRQPLFFGRTEWRNRRSEIIRMIARLRDLIRGREFTCEQLLEAQTMQSDLPRARVRVKNTSYYRLLIEDEKL